MKHNVIKLSQYRLFRNFLTATFIIFLQGCAPAIVVVGATTGAVVATDNRSAGALIDDELIETKAKNALASDEDLWKNSHINVTSYNNIVLMTGEVPNTEYRDRAIELLEEIRPIRIIYSEVVAGPVSTMLSRTNDTYLTSKVKSAMLLDSEINSLDIKVITENDVVYLMGLITARKADVAVEITRNISGVKKVVKVFEYIEPTPV